ncbi:PEP-CTERM sorting domain-containing protein [Nostocaceae cyanobacterium CENA369]|uniref:PEP-CTERM sorting domain-containing protein n=1 Tax=Dendronalium phyllosphericum CENA369 TaxID=1725256 RepID=A0A8J7LGU5_9NOST|nr:PEP-CTERM sorting domain-containing protein [Dendronalium phyllosphericum]MBH8577402.1 PEP-CTERM sorting domain-containing protein [Dendronalium phyllosphericum CENA369]
MTDSIFKKLAVATVGTVLVFSVGETLPAQAANLTYSFANVDKTLTGTFSFDEAAAADQQVTISEGLKIIATYNGQSYTEANDSSALVLTNFSGKIPQGQGLGLQFVVPDAFTVYSGNFINPKDPTDAGVQSITYTPVPEPNSILGLSVLGLGLFLGKKIASKSSSTKA